MKTKAKKRGLNKKKGGLFGFTRKNNKNNIVPSDPYEAVNPRNLPMCNTNLAEIMSHARNNPMDAREQLQTIKEACCLNNDSSPYCRQVKTNIKGLDQHLNPKLCGNVPSLYVIDEFDNTINVEATTTKMHQNYQQCCPKDYLGRVNNSPYCKELKTSFDKVRNNVLSRNRSEFNNDMNNVNLQGPTYAPPKRRWYKRFFGGKKTKNHRRKKTRKSI